ncbi:hypothetical protein D081_1436 [Anaerovibrio sp. JC8]|uniref:hypothetical protein n=1 Tax=Anaerovibrio sp. JC8 TaxID=1240085 RepID=UPI000A0EB9CD|nr:hypothetical protein [Anaerovibrio sp. JC8]ORT99855.1 hypothetical protein D081_1436 [Anaerovibrio sp. JC8]
MVAKTKTVEINNVKEVPLKELLSEDTLGKQDLLARMLSGVFVRYKVDAELQQVFRNSLKEVIHSVAEDCFTVGYDSGYAVGLKDGNAIGRKEFKAEEEKAMAEFQNKLEEELVREILMNVKPDGMLQ